MASLEKSVRFAAMGVAALFVGLGVVGILGAWWFDFQARDVAQKGFGIVETAVAVVDAGVSRVDGLIASSRTEVRQAAETISAVGSRAEANSPVLTALNERLDSRLEPGIAKMQQALNPVREAVGKIGDVVSLVNSLPIMADRSPSLTALDDGFNRRDESLAVVKQLRGTLRELVGAQKREVSAETIATLNALTQRIDNRLGEVQAGVQGLRSEIKALQARLDARKARVLFVLNILAVVTTLALGWIVYSQFVVIRHYRG